MKKLIISGLAALPLSLGLYRFAGATSTQFSLPSWGDLLGNAIDTASPFLTALWPILGVIVGLGFLGWIVGKLTNIF